MTTTSCIQCHNLYEPVPRAGSPLQKALPRIAPDCFAKFPTVMYGTNLNAGTGTNTPAQPHEAASVTGANAFADPATLSDFVNFCRHKGEELGARAVISIVPKAQVAFPQVSLCIVSAVDCLPTGVA